MNLNQEELMKEVARIRILTRHLLDDRLAGDYASTFKGQGITFEEARPYQPGDDVRAIDWNVTARTLVPYIKRFSEERQLTVLFAVDVSGSQAFGTGARTKLERAAELTALLAMVALRNQDNVGLLTFSDRILTHLPPRKGRTAVLRLIRELLATQETHQGTNIREALRFLTATQRRRAVIFLISDFQAADYEPALVPFAHRHDLIACRITDPAELTLPNLGLVELWDPETHTTQLVDTRSRATREAYATAAATQRAAQTSFFKRHGIDLLDVTTDKPYASAVRSLFERRRGRG